MFGDRLRELRQQKNLTQQALGELVNLTKANISKYENGKLEPNLETLQRFADFFDVSIDYLLGRKDKSATDTPADDVDDDLKLPETIAAYRAAHNMEGYEELSEEARRILKRVLKTIYEVDAEERRRLEKQKQQEKE